jgi:penicillin amidase
VATLLGPDPATWTWGDLQYSLFEHPLSPVVDEATRARLNVGPFPRGGSELTVNASSFQNNDFRHISGPSFRMVLDVGNWDHSLAVNTPGQSGSPVAASSLEKLHVGQVLAFLRRARKMVVWSNVKQLAGGTAST